MSAAADRLVLRPLAAGDEAELLRVHQAPEVARWWDAPAGGFPWDEPESTSAATTASRSTEHVAAVRGQEEAGFRAVGVMRRAERDAGGEGWHDALLM